MSCYAPALRSALHLLVYGYLDLAKAKIAGPRAVLGGHTFLILACSTSNNEDARPLALQLTAMMGILSRCLLPYILAERNLL